MSANARFGHTPPLRGAHDGTLKWLAVVVLLVTVLTSESLWAIILDRVGLSDSSYFQNGDLADITPEEKRMLLKMTAEPAQSNELTPVEATKRNRSIPFSETPVAMARPFKLSGTSLGTASTALRCLTQAVYYEAAFEPLAGRRAVAQVVLNRMRHPAFPNSVCGVVYQGVNKPVCQFSFTCDGSLNRRPNPAAWNEAEMVARDALNGHVEEQVGYATHYHANYVSPYWAPKLVKIAKIGAHIFYRWPGGWGLPRSFLAKYAGVETMPNILPRSFVSKNVDRIKPNMATSEVRLLNAVLPASHEDSTAGGRIDVSKGWTAVLPEPEEMRRSSHMIARQQSAEFEVVQNGDGL